MYAHKKMVDTLRFVGLRSQTQLEMAFAFKYIKAYKGPLLHSLILALLFGLLHWLPLARAGKAAP